MTRRNECATTGREHTRAWALRVQFTLHGRNRDCDVEYKQQSLLYCDMTRRLNTYSSSSSLSSLGRAWSSSSGSAFLLRVDIASKCVGKDGMKVVQENWRKVGAGKGAGNGPDYIDGGNGGEGELGDWGRQWVRVYKGRGENTRKGKGKEWQYEPKLPANGGGERGINLTKGGRRKPEVTR